jgi:tRNA A37 methylthiotransferase MiaB
MLGATLRAGYQPTPNGDDADYIVVNTCGFLRCAASDQTLGSQLIRSAKHIILSGVQRSSHPRMVGPHSAQLSGLQWRRAARDESLETIGELSAQRKAGARLVVAGCMAGSLYRSEIEAAFGSQVVLERRGERSREGGGRGRGGARL